jgi:hypothetical protein
MLESGEGSQTLRNMVETIVIAKAHYRLLSSAAAAAADDDDDSMTISLIYKYRRWYRMCSTTFQLKNIRRKVLNCSYNAFYYCIFILYIVLKDCYTEQSECTN